MASIISSCTFCCFLLQAKLLDLNFKTSLSFLTLLSIVFPIFCSIASCCVAVSRASFANATACVLAFFSSSLRPSCPNLFSTSANASLACSCLLVKSARLLLRPAAACPNPKLAVPESFKAFSLASFTA